MLTRLQLRSFRAFDASEVAAIQEATSLANTFLATICPSDVERITVHTHETAVPDHDDPPTLYTTHVITVIYYAQLDAAPESEAA
jgi:hypothetical protein